MRSLYISMGTKSNEIVLVRGRKGHRHKGECHVKIGAEIGAMYRQLEKCQGLLATPRNQARVWSK